MEYNYVNLNLSKNQSDNLNNWIKAINTIYPNQNPNISFNIIPKNNNQYQIIAYSKLVDLYLDLSI